MTRNTCSIHHYTSSWSSAKFTRFHVFETKIMKIFGPKVSDFFMVKLARNIYCNGLAVTVKKVLRLFLLSFRFICIDWNADSRGRTV